MALTFTIPLLPPGLNHYVEHPATGIHFKSKAAKAWEDDFPIFSRGQFVTGERFMVTLRFTMGAGQRGDVDNFNKLPLDCCAKAGMFRNAKGKWLSDAWVKRLVVEILDSDDDRQRGPQTEITIEAMPCLTTSLNRPSKQRIGATDATGKRPGKSRTADYSSV